MHENEKKPLDLPDRVGAAVERGVSWWMFGMILAFFFTLIVMPWWCLILLIPFGYVTYKLMLLITTILLARTVTAEEYYATIEAEKRREVRQKLAAGEHTPEETMNLMHEAGMTDHVVVEETSEPIGRYKENDIYDWILVRAPGQEKAEKFMYHGPADVVDGLPVIPMIPGVKFANVNGVLYSFTEPA